MEEEQEGKGDKGRGKHCMNIVSVGEGQELN